MIGVNWHERSFRKGLSQKGLYAVCTKQIKRQNITDCSPSQFEVQDQQIICPLYRTDNSIELKNIMDNEDIIDFITTLVDQESAHG